MQLSNRADYAIRAMVDMASKPRGTVAITREIAHRQGLPLLFLAKIVPQLARAGLVRTYRGTAGGLLLNRPPEEITLLQVVEAVDGPIHLNRCLIRSGECPREVHCPVRDVFGEAQDHLVSLLSRYTLADMVARENYKAASQEK
ncbi:MAG: Rrf2 family transcriptional regulator [Chloroflexi bacterium]|nr:Rrf2 family transcriptional regulator [Chloroflexota bacterium]